MINSGQPKTVSNLITLCRTKYERKCNDLRISKNIHQGLKLLESQGALCDIKRLLINIDIIK